MFIGAGHTGVESLCVTDLHYSGSGPCREVRLIASGPRPHYESHCQRSPRSWVNNDTLFCRMFQGLQGSLPGASQEPGLFLGRVPPIVHPTPIGLIRLSQVPVGLPCLPGGEKWVFGCPIQALSRGQARRTWLCFPWGFLIRATASWSCPSVFSFFILLSVSLSCLCFFGFFFPYCCLLGL